MNIKIINCSNENYWYKDKIGQTYKFAFMDGDNYVVETPIEEYDLGSVLPQDAETIE